MTFKEEKVNMYNHYAILESLTLMSFASIRFSLAVKNSYWVTEELIIYAKRS